MRIGLKKIGCSSAALLLAACASNDAQIGRAGNPGSTAASGVTPTAGEVVPPEDPATLALIRAGIAPRVDHHQHLVGPTALPVQAPLLPPVSVPAGLNRLLSERARLWGNAKSISEIRNVFTQDAKVLSFSDPTRWVTGDDLLNIVNERSPATYAYVPNSYAIKGSIGYVSGTVTWKSGETWHHFMNFMMGIVKAKDGSWRIAAEQTTAKTEPRYPQPITAKALVDQLDDARIERAIVLSVAFWMGGRFTENPADEMTKQYDLVKAENDWTREQVAAFPGRLVMACGVNIHRAYAVAELERCSRFPEAKAFKLHFGDSGVDLKVPEHLAKVQKFFKAANDLRVPIIVHFGPRFDYDRQYVETFLSQVMTLAPDIVVQIAHMGGDGPGLTSPEGTAAWAEVMQAGDPRTRNLYFDFAGLITGNMTAEQAEMMVTRMRQIGLSRILYASDGQPPNRPTAAHWMLTRRKLPLTVAELKTIAENVAPYMRSSR
jgi:predicted TIM-barrel fold metal-dependent hydrolase